jgi:hypothetical protein
MSVVAAFEAGSSVIWVLGERDTTQGQSVGPGKMGYNSQPVIHAGDCTVVTHRADVLGRVYASRDSHVLMDIIDAGDHPRHINLEVEVPGVFTVARLTAISQ